MPDDTISNAQYTPFLRKRRPDGSTEDYSLEEHLLSNDPHGNIYIKRGEISDTKFTPAVDITNDETTVPASSVVYRVNEKVNAHINATTPAAAHGDLYAVKNHDHASLYSAIGHNHDTVYSKEPHVHDQYLERSAVENCGIYPRAYYELYDQNNDFNHYTTQGVYYVGGKFINAPAGIASPDDYEGFLSVTSARIGTNNITSSRVVFQMYTTKNTIWRRVGRSDNNDIIVFSGWVVGAGDSAPIGSLLTMTGDEVPAGYLEANGAAISCSNYKLLWEYVVGHSGVVIPNLVEISSDTKTFNVIDDDKFSLCSTRYSFLGPKIQISDQYYYTPVSGNFIDTEITDEHIGGYLLDDDDIPQIVKYVRVTDTTTIYVEGVHFRKNHGTVEYIDAPHNSDGTMTFNNNAYYIYEKTSTPEYAYRLVKLSAINIADFRYASSTRTYKYCTANNFEIELSSAAFRIPNLNNRYLYITTGDSYYNADGTVLISRETLSGQEAGLPNITGKHSMGSKNGAENYTSSGAFYVESASVDTSITGGRVGNAENASKVTVVFNASSSNSVYGNSDTVTPRNVAVRVFIKASEGNLLPADASIGEVQAAVDAYLSANPISEASTMSYGTVKLATSYDLTSSTLSNNVVTASLLRNTGYVKRIVFDGNLVDTATDGTVVINSQTLESNRLHTVTVNPHNGGYYDVEIPYNVALKLGVDTHGNYVTNNINIEYSLMSTGGYSSSYEGGSGTYTYKGIVNTLPSTDVAVGDVYQYDIVDENNNTVSTMKVWTGTEWSDIICFARFSVTGTSEVQYLQLPVTGQTVAIDSTVYVESTTNVAGYPIGAAVLNDKQVRFAIYTDTAEVYEGTIAAKLKMRIYWPDNWTGVTFDGTSGTFVGDITPYDIAPVDWKLAIRLKY